MILNVWAYTRNSIYEKGVFAMLDKARIEIGLKNKEVDAIDEMIRPEEESNG